MSIDVPISLPTESSYAPQGILFPDRLPHVAWYGAAAAVLMCRHGVQRVPAGHGNSMWASHVRAVSRSAEDTLPRPASPCHVIWSRSSRAHVQARGAADSRWSRGQHADIAHSCRITLRRGYSSQTRFLVSRSMACGSVTAAAATFSLRCESEWFPRAGT